MEHHLKPIHIFSKFQAHELMSSEELSQVFQVDNHQDVPEYQIVNIHHRRHKRSAEKQSIHQVKVNNLIWIT